MKEDITSAQLRAARGLVDWSRDQLAQASGTTVRTLARLETGETSPRVSTLAAIRTALETAGVEFIPENGGGAGVRLRKDGAITSPTTAQTDPDDAPELTEAFFDQAQISEGGQIIRKGPARRASKMAGKSN